MERKRKRHTNKFEGTFCVGAKAKYTGDLEAKIKQFFPLYKKIIHKDGQYILFSFEKMPPLGAVSGAVRTHPTENNVILISFTVNVPVKGSMSDAGNSTMDEFVRITGCELVKSLEFEVWVKERHYQKVGRRQRVAILAKYEGELKKLITYHKDDKTHSEFNVFRNTENPNSYRVELTMLAGFVTGSVESVSGVANTVIVEFTSTERANDHRDLIDSAVGVFLGFTQAKLVKSIRDEVSLLLDK